MKKNSSNIIILTLVWIHKVTIQIRSLNLDYILLISFFMLCYPKTLPYFWLWCTLATKRGMYNSQAWQKTNTVKTLSHPEI